MTKKKIEQIAEELGWSVFWATVSGKKVLELTTYSPAGQELIITLYYNSLDEISQGVYEEYDSYDPSYEAYLWLDESGHGKNGAPHDMGDVYNDMVACEDMIYKLYDALTA